MEAKIQKWGNSLGIRISHNIVKELHLEANDIVDIKQKCSGDFENCHGDLQYGGLVLFGNGRTGSCP